MIKANEKNLKQVTKDEDVTSFYSPIIGATCAFSFCKKLESRSMNRSIIVATERAIELQKPFRLYLANEIAAKGIKIEDVTKEQRQDIINRFLETQKVANQMLGFKY